jgi:hypothetical protein
VPVCIARVPTEKTLRKASVLTVISVTSIDLKQLETWQTEDVPIISAPQSKRTSVETNVKEARRGIVYLKFSGVHNVTLGEKKSTFPTA